VNDITTAERSGVFVITVARPDRANALRRETVRQLGEALSEVKSRAMLSPVVQGVVITGGGTRFSGGADLTELVGTIDDIEFDDELEIVTEQIAKAPFPVVAAVEGPCFGAAVDLAWSCDAVVVSRVARIALPATRLGILYNPVSIARLHARLGSAVLRRLLVLGDELRGRDLAELSVAVVVDEGDTVEAALGLFGSDPVPEATAATKAVLASLDTEGFDPARWQESRCTLLSSPERLRVLRSAQESVRETND